MANHGAKFVSVNLNKSYGQQHQPSHHTHFPHFAGSYGQAAAAGRSRGGGGGMVVLSRNRAGPAKAVSKLSVPPPLNLPSLRKEHEKFDIAGPGGHGAGAGTGSGSRPTSSGVGWTKPAPTASQEKNETGDVTSGVDGGDAVDGPSRGVGSYMPPSARSNVIGVVGSVSGSASQAPPPPAEKAVVLRGEDFPSLQAARPLSSGASQKQKDGLQQKQKHAVSEESTQEKRDSQHLGPQVDMHPLGHSSRNHSGNSLGENGGKCYGVGSRQMVDRLQKEDSFRDPLPLVTVNPRSDWADDERDTGHGLVDWGRDIGFSKAESYWDRDFDLPRHSAWPHKPAQSEHDKWGQRDNETGKKFSTEVLKMGQHKDARVNNWEGSKWRNATFSKDGFNSQEVARVGTGARMADHSDIVRENKYIPPHSADIGRDGNFTPKRDPTFGRRDLDVVVRQQQQQQRHLEPFIRGSESRDSHVLEKPNSYKVDGFQNNTSSKSAASSRGKLPSITDPILTMGRDRRFSKSDRPFSDDPFLRDFDSAGFDERDIFSGGLVGVIKRKKDATRSTDFYDPVRESFEAELERVQKTQELERHRIIEEQERVMEQARREEEERQRRIREEEELHRKLEEEAQEAAWRAEQERLEAVQRAEEQRIAREEEKRSMQLEEERRKQAAKQKLLELEARMAKREAEVGKAGDSVTRTSVDEKLEAGSQEKNITRNLDLDTWEDGERMVENVMASGSYDSSALTRSDTSPKPYPFREGSSNFIVRGKDSNSWRRDVFENGSSFPPLLPGQEIGHYSLKQDGFTGGRAALRKEFHGGSMPSRPYTKTGMQEPYSEEFSYQKDNRWGLSGNVSSFGKHREVDSEFPDSSMTDKYADNGWGQGQSPGNNRLSYPERFYPYSEDNEFYSYGRSRFSMRQPRVLPPPLGATQRTTFDGVAEHVDPSMLLDNSDRYTHAARIESTRQTDYYGSNQVGHELSEIFGLQRENTSSEEPKLDNASRCDSQSSLSVSSPPISPPHMSHDELDESGYSPVKSTVAEGKRSFLPVGESAAHDDNSRNSTTVTALDSVSAVEDEEWSLENDVRMQHQEEYDEVEDGYREEDELREGDEGNLELNQKFQGLELEAREPSHIGHNVVIDFDGGVQVVISSDNSERHIGTQEASNGNSASSTCIMVEKKSVDGFTSEQSALPAVACLATHEDSYSRQVSDKSALQSASVERISSPYSSAAVNPVDGADATGSAIFAAQQNVSSSDDAATAVSQTSSTSLSSGSQGDLPVKLQFGLFSGPSLIPSPVPAIQIGSIQMPLHIHPPVGPYTAHMHSSQPSMFQFGQVHYTSPVSQGILPIAPQSMPFLQPNMMGPFNQNQKTGGSVNHESAGDASTRDVNNDEMQPFSINRMPSAVSALPEQSDRSLSWGLNTVVNAGNNGGNTVGCSSSSVVSGTGNKKMKSVSGSQAEEMGHHHTVKSQITPLKVRGPESQSHHRQPMMQTVGEKNSSGLSGSGLLPGGRGRRFAYKVKNTNTSSSSQNSDMPPESNGFQRRPRRTLQRTEFRIRESNDRRPASLVVSNNAGLDDKSNYDGKTVGVLTRTGSKRGTLTTRYFRQKIESESPALSQNLSSGDRAKEANLSTKTQHTSHYREAKLRTASEEDVDAPLQSGVVRVFKQPGIEAPSDEDDFIEVRSKRQMLNDRREQREKEIKEKSRSTKPPRKPHTTRQKHVLSRGHDKVSISVSIEESNKSQFDFIASEGPQCTGSEVSTGFITTLSQPEKGTSAVNSEALDVKSHQVGSTHVVSDAKTEHNSGQISDSKNQVMSLSQTQIDEAMKPAQFDSISAVGSHSGTLSDTILATSAILTKDKPYSSGASQINSLLAGEEIQFGAVTSPTVLPGSCVVSHGSGIPSSKPSEMQSSQKFSLSEKDDLFAIKEKSLGDSSAPLQDCEAEAEAAASAVFVAAISSDEISGNALGSVNKTNSFSGTDVDEITPGVVGDQQLAHQSRGEELLSVSLPADLSVETTPISLWPPLPSPQSSSGQMLSHFPGGPPSHFPFYEMNPLLGGPIFAFSPHEESSGTQSQAQKSTASSSGPLGNWQQGHSGVDSFYGPHAGYAGPYISSPGGIPGVQGPPHMVLYNHFAPVGQYGQVGLSFMGTTYIPSGKQADWKNLPVSSTMPIGEGEMNNLKTTNAQRNAPPNMTAPIQHLAPGSPLLPIPSPLPTFDLSPFQTAPDLPAHAQWGHIPASHLHSAPLQPQGEGAVPSQVNHGHSIDQSLPPSRFTEARTLTTSDSAPSFTVAADKSVDEFRQLGLVGSIISTPASSVHSVTIQSSSGSPDTESVKIDTIEKGNNQNATFVKSKFSQKNASTQQGNIAGFGYQRGSTPQRTNTRNEWSHRRMGFHGRNQSAGVGKGYPAAKMKQIYVAKQTSTNSSTTT